MQFGNETKITLARLSQPIQFGVASDWSPNEYTVPFNVRLISFIGDFYSLPVKSSEKVSAIKALLREGCDRCGCSISSTTVDNWLKNSSDPSLSSSNPATRSNLYKIAAALDLDFELTSELFEKVFFTKPFNLKDPHEVLFFYYAVQDFNTGLEGSQWYAKGMDAYEKLFNEAVLPSEPTTARITSTEVIAGNIEALDEVAFLEFISANKNTFSPDNYYRTASEMIKELAEKLSGADSASYVPLIAAIIGYNQRDDSGGISGMDTFPVQIRANFPTGAILRDICLGKEKSVDRISKMLKLLSFYTFFYNSSGLRTAKSQFSSYLIFSNNILNAASLPELYPRNPFDALLLYCATQEDPDPIETLQSYIISCLKEQKTDRLMEKLHHFFPQESEETLEDLLANLNYDEFTVDLLDVLFYLKDSPDRTVQCLAQPEKLSEEIENFDLEQQEGDAVWAEAGSSGWAVLQLFFKYADFSNTEKNVLRIACLFPDRCLSKELYGKLFTSEWKRTVNNRLKFGWLSFDKKGNLLIDYRVCSLIRDQDWEPTFRNMTDFANILENTIVRTDLTASEKKELENIKLRLYSLDGAPAKSRKQG